MRRQLSAPRTSPLPCQLPPDLPIFGRLQFPLVFFVLVLRPGSARCPNYLTEERGRHVFPSTHPAQQQHHGQRMRPLVPPRPPSRTLALQGIATPLGPAPKGCCSLPRALHRLRALAPPPANTHCARASGPSGPAKPERFLPPRDPRGETERSEDCGLERRR